MSKHPRVLATVVGGLGLVWNERSERQRTIEDVGMRINAAAMELGELIDATNIEVTTQICSTKAKLSTQIDAAKDKLISEAQDTQSIALCSAYATVEEFSGNYSMIQKLPAHMESCAASGGAKCDPVKRIVAAVRNGPQELEGK